MITWTPDTVQLSDLRPWERNPKTISKAHAKRLLETWQRLGQFQTLAIGPDGEVYDGHQRLSVLKAAHGENYEVRVLRSSRPLTEEEREQIVILAHVGTTGQFNWDELANWDAGQLQEWGLDGETLQDWKTGIGALTELIEAAKPEPPEDPGAQVDKADELREKWGVETGQMWRLGDHRLICGDCTDKSVVDRVMGVEKAACMWTDPPYGVEYVGKTKDALTIENDGADNLLGLLTAAFMTAESVLIGGAPFYVAHPAGAQQYNFWKAIIEIGWKIHQQLVWVKDSMVLGHSDYHLKHETILYGWTPGDGRPGRGDHDGSHWYGDNSQVSVFEIPRPKRSEEHPTMKPPELVEAHLQNSTLRGGIVYEPFSGSGTTLIACERLSRKCRAVEISPAYVAVSIQRWVDMTGGTPELITDAQ